MQAAQINDYGGPDALKVQTTDKPDIVPDQVLVEVYAAAVNPFDWKVREGLARLPDGVNFPATLGGDLAGVVVQVGAQVSNFKAGDQVFGQANALSGQGSFAEYAPVKASSLAIKPLSLDFVNAAALPLTGVSAYQALVEHLNLLSGQKILIHGGAGGIGSLAIQLAKYLGAYVATTAAPADHDYVKQLGADEAIDYASQDFSTFLKDYDAVFDTVGGETFSKSFKVLKPGGTIVSMAAQPNDNLSQQYQVKAIHQFTRTTTEKLQQIAQLIDQSVLKAQVEKIYPLSQAATALEELKTAHSRGKLVIKIKD